MADESMSLAEREAREIIHRNLMALADFMAAIRAGTELAFFDPPDLNVVGAYTLIQWHGIATRDIVMMLYHIESALKALCASVPVVPALERVVDRGKLRRATALFRKHFPEAHNVRQIVAHWGDYIQVPDRLQRHSSTQWARPIGGHLPPPLYDREIGERRVSGAMRPKQETEARRFLFDVTEQTWPKLEEVDTLVREAFSDARKLNLLS